MMDRVFNVADVLHVAAHIREEIHETMDAARDFFGRRISFLMPARGVASNNDKPQRDTKRQL